MKKIIVILLSVIMLFTSCTQNTESTQSNIEKNLINENPDITNSSTSTSEQINENDSKITLPKAITKTAGGMTVTIDPKMEMAFIMSELSKENPFGDSWDIEYKTKCKKYFSEFKNHKIVTDPAYGYLINTHIQLLNDNLEISKDIQRDDIFAIRDKDFNKAIQSFYIDTNFGNFFEQNRKYYEEIINEVTYDYEKFNYIPWVDKFYGYGISDKSYIAVIQPLLMQAYYLPNTAIKNVYIYTSNMFKQDLENSPTYGGIILHEINHSYMTPLMNEYENDINKYSNLYDKVQTKMQKMYYTNWNSCFEEHLCEAIVVRYLKERYNNEVYQNYIRKRTDMGFEYIEAICNKLSEYEKNRDKYKTFEEFYPELLTCLDQFI